MGVQLAVGVEAVSSYHFDDVVFEEEVVATLEVYRLLYGTASEVLPVP